MNFQRSQSKVWFGSHTNSAYDKFYSLPTIIGDARKKSLQSISEQHEESLSPKYDADLKRSMLLWGNRKSPSSHSHKSQDSGFSDVETSPTLSANKKNISASSDDGTSPKRSHSACSGIATPPTVIRRPLKMPIYEEIPSVKRLSFSAPSSPINEPQSEKEDVDINFSSISPLHSNGSSRSSCRSSKIKRSRVITKNSSRRSVKSSFDDSLSNRYNNETVYFGIADGDDDSELEQKSLLNFPGGTSTPKKSQITLDSLEKLIPPNVHYKNELLNGNFKSVQSWIDGLKFSLSNEYMSTLQSKSIEAGNNMLTPTLAFKLIKSLQSKVFLLQHEFEKIEKCTSETLMLLMIQSITDLMVDFVAGQEQKKKYYVQNPKYFKILNENLRSLREMSTDLKRLVGKIDVIDLEDYPLDDDLQLIKRFLLITVRVIFKLLVSVIVDNIEHAQNEMVLRSNITHVVNLLSCDMNITNINGFSSLNDAWISTSLVRVLLLVCIENRNTSIRCLSLRTLSLVCTTEETIQQLNINSGLEILRDIIINGKCSDQEIREAISCLASLTAPWQQDLLMENSFKDLKDYAEDYIEGITKIMERIENAPTMLVCVAVLNNLSSLDASSVYSLISHQSLSKISDVYKKLMKGEYTIFLLQQITSLIFNMSCNRKSHYHLTNKKILNFILDIFLSVFNRQYNQEAQIKAQRNVMSNVVNCVRQLEVASTTINQDVASLKALIEDRVSSFNALSTSFNISRNTKNVTKISIYSQETFF